VSLGAPISSRMRNAVNRLVSDLIPSPICEL